MNNNRVVYIKNSIDERLENDRKRHLQAILGTKRINDERVWCIKFLYIDTPKYWEYVEQLLSDYCESLTEIRRTKTTLTVRL